MFKSKVFQVVAIIVIFILIISFSFVGCKKTTIATETTTVETTAIESDTIAAETTATETKSAEPVEIIYWAPVQSNDPMVTVFTELDKRMREKYNISVKFETQAMDGWFQLMTTIGMSQQGPDLLFNWSGVAAVIKDGRNNLYQPLNDILPAGMSDKVSGWQSTTDTDGKIYAVPAAISTSCIAYNKSLFDKAGIDYSGYPKLWYWDEFLDVCKKLKDAGVTPLGLANKEGYYGEWWIANPITSYFDSNEEMFKYFQNDSMDSQPMLDVLEKYKTLYDNGYLLKEGLTLDHSSNTQQEFTSEKVAMQWSDAAMYQTYADALGADKVGVTFWPNFSDKGKLAKAMDCVSYWVVGVTPWSKHQKEALLVLQELFATQWGADTLNEISGYNPTYKEFKPKEIAGNDYSKYVVKYMDLGSKEGFGSYAYDTWTPEFSMSIYKFNGMFLSGDMTATEFAKELDAARGIK